MSLKVIKAGILDSIQDPGRYGYQQYGINPGGVMDSFAARAANLLLGNPINEAVIEMHFPASTFLIEQSCVLALTGADFAASIDDVPVECNTAFNAKENSTLSFKQHHKGARCYMAVKGGFNLPKWLDSYSTNFKAEMGGFAGRRLLKNDVIVFRRNTFPVLPSQKSNNTNNTENYLHSDEVFVLPGNEWDWLTPHFQDVLLKNGFTITPKSDRMGFNLNGISIEADRNDQLISSPVCSGTIQLLPDGQLIILMADHQTTGGYPRIVHVITAHFPILGQKKAGDQIQFRMTDTASAEKLLFEQEKLFL